MKRVLKWLGALVLFVFAVLIVFNWNSLDDGLRYVRDMLAYTSTPAKPLAANGRFGFCQQYMTLRNAQRAQFIQNYLDERNISFQLLPIYDSGFNNIFVPISASGPYTIFSAHYDKRYDDPEYQGASDNSAADCLLLVAAEELNKQQPTKPVAILFTGEEEVGLVGAKAFYEYATQNNLQVAQAVNLDNIGRAGLGSRASGERSGYAFTIPLLGEFIYDGRTLAPALPYRQPDASLLDQLSRVESLTRYDRMIAKSDATFWQVQGWNAVTLSSDDIYFLDITWHTYGDRAELLDEINFERALNLVVGFARQGS
ncbi:MAG TPA: M28 family peptidase [Anaerolineae bacterium]|nr:M28 family peptidase [Anaerolineae bacterium]